MHHRHTTTVLYEYFVSEVSGQDKGRDKERVENADRRVLFVLLNPLDQPAANSERSTLRTNTQHKVLVLYIYYISC
jgi:hypothetical protein